jgi:transposase
MKQPAPPNSAKPANASKPSTPFITSSSPPLLAAVDVSAGELVVAWRAAGAVAISTLNVANTTAGHRTLLRRLRAQAGEGPVRVAMEATGVYSLGLALALHGQPGFEVMVVNPRAVKDFIRATMTRAKTDQVDARGILDYLARMPFAAWTPPAPEVLTLQQLSRRLQQLKAEHARERNRQHAIERLPAALRTLLRRDLRTGLGQLEKRIAALEKTALGHIAAHATLAPALALACSIPGIAHKSGLRLLGELLVLPKGLKAPQWVAHAGLDPRPMESGTSVHKPRRLSKTGNANLRAALFLPALVAIRRNAAVGACYQALIARGKKPKQAVIAIMRKLLHALWGILHHHTPFNEALFYQPQKTPIPA